MSNAFKAERTERSMNMSSAQFLALLPQWFTCDAAQKNANIKDKKKEGSMVGTITGFKLLAT